MNIELPHQTWSETLDSDVECKRHSGVKSVDLPATLPPPTDSPRADGYWQAESVYRSV